MISMCDIVVSQPNLMMVERKNYHSLKELEQLQHLNAKTAAANKVRAKYKKQYQILQLPTKKRKPNNSYIQ